MTTNEKAALRDFRRAFHRARTAFVAFERTGGVGFRISWTQSEFSSQATGPDGAEVTRFLVAMRRFLVPDDRLHLEALCRFGRGLGLLQRGSKESDFVEDQLIRLRRGLVEFTVNSMAHDAADLYERISSGGFFESDPKAEAFVKALFELPGTAVLVRFAFVNYAVCAFQLLEVIFELFHQQRLFDRPAAVTESSCIYCLDREGPFTSEEHVFPEALGNDEIVLPLGLVCDRCNNGVLAGLDSALVSFPPIAFLVVQFVPHTKDGRLPSANFQNLKIEKTGPRHLHFAPKDKTGEFREMEKLPDGSMRFKLEIRGQRFEPRLLGRALFKVGLGLVALEEGPAAVRADRFEAARQFVISDLGFENNLVIRTVGEPKPTVSAYRHPSLPGTAFAFDIFGVVIVVNLETEPTLEVPRAMSDHKFVTHSLARGSGAGSKARSRKTTALR